jgi:hypothetical protein
MTAAYLCGITGIENRTIDNSAAYIAGWLRNDRKLIVHDAAQAQRACDYAIIGLESVANQPLLVGSGWPL